MGGRGPGGRGAEAVPQPDGHHALFQPLLLDPSTWRRALPTAFLSGKQKFLQLGVSLMSTGIMLGFLYVICYFEASY